MLIAITANTNAQWPHFNSVATYCIVKGYIPKGTRYAINDDMDQICARKMILNI